MKKYLLSLIALMLGIVGVTAEPITLDLAGHQSTTTCSGYTITIDDYTFTANPGNACKSPYQSCKSPFEYHHYTGNTLTVSTSGNENMTKLTFVMSENVKNWATLTPTNGKMTYDPVTGFPVWKGNAKEVTFTVNLVKSSCVYGGWTIGEFTFAQVILELATPRVETPTFTPKGGSYFESQNVEIACGTEGASIQYSTDGENYEDYEGAINISETTTLYAKATLCGGVSNVATATYEIAENYPSIDDIISKGDEKYGKPVIVFLNNVISGITDHSIVVTTADQKTTATIDFGKNMPTGWENDGKVVGKVWGFWKFEGGVYKLVVVGHELIYLPKVYAPTFNHDGGDYYDKTLSIELSCQPEGTKIYYSFDNKEWKEYTGAFNITESCTIYTYARYYHGDYYNEGAKNIVVYEIAKEYETIDKLSGPTSKGMPVIITDLYNEIVEKSGNSIYVMSGTQKVEIYFENLPKDWENWKVGGKFFGKIWGSWILIDGVWRLKVVGNDLQYLPKPEQPTGLTADDYYAAQTITLSCEPEGTKIYYSFDNKNWKEYTGAFTITESCTIYTYGRYYNGTHYHQGETIFAHYEIAKEYDNVDDLVSKNIDGKPVIIIDLYKSIVKKTDYSIYVMSGENEIEIYFKNGHANWSKWVVGGKFFGRIWGYWRYYNGHWRLEVVDNTMSYIDKVELPQFSVKGGAYYDAQTVTITCIPAGAEIWWSYNGINWEKYTGPINVTSSCTIYSYGRLHNGNYYNDGKVSHVDYTIAKTYDDPSEAVDDDPENLPVIVYFNNVPISRFDIVEGKTMGFYVPTYNDKKTEIELWGEGVPANWEVDGAISGYVRGYWKHLENGTWRIEVENYDHLTYVAPATVTVYNAENVLMVNDKGEVQPLVNGVNHLRTGNYTITPVGKRFIKVTLNGELLDRTAYKYDVTLVAGDEVVIGPSDIPEFAVVKLISERQNDIKGVVKTIQHSNAAEPQLFGWTERIEALNGYDMILTLDEDAYQVHSVKINDKYIEGENGVFKFYVFGNADVLIDAEEVVNSEVADNDVSTGINNIEAEKQEVVYNVAGQRLNKMHRGINIVNGKKVLKK